MKTCNFLDCGYPVLSKGLCAAHYQQQHKGRTLTPVERRPYQLELCRVKECSRPRHARGLCNRHSSIACRYSIAPEDMEVIYESGCANPSCQSKDNLHIDHDHTCCPGNESCGKCVRGVLCGSCNITLGWLEKINREGGQVAGLIDYLSTGARLELSPFKAVYHTARRGRSRA